MDINPQKQPKTARNLEIIEQPVVSTDRQVPRQNLSLPEKPEETEEEAISEKSGGFKNILSTIAILLIAPLIALTLTAFVFQSYEVDGPSMGTTLQNQDRLIVYKLPRTLARITNKPYLPNRGDIVIFNRDEGGGFGTPQTSRQLIKRVVALPGERVLVKEGHVTVFNNEKPGGFNPDEDPRYAKAITDTPGDVPETTVPENSVFVLGDNRHNSLDSRSFGPVTADQLVGRLALRVYPFSKGHQY